MLIKQLILEQDKWRNLKENCYDSIMMKVETMAVTRKSVKVADSKVYNTELIYSRVVKLQASSWDVDISEVISCELSPVPTALFNDSGVMRISKSKSELKTLTKMEVSARHPTPEATSTVIDGCTLLWIPQWPSSTSTQWSIIMDFVRKFKHHIRRS